ncbi:hypothetical protein C0J52_06101 [Blattella germanica]|nr:hypothetical protein C0J52_06101 [Blattella germanica]
MSLLQIPVYRGASRSLLVTPPIEDFFGKDGLGDFVYPDPPNPSDCISKEHAAIALVRLVTQYPNQITLLCLGPLTNVALAIRLDPLFITKVKQIIILGGSTEGVGNVRPGVEFNFYVDPEANFIVFDAVASSAHNTASPIVLLPWESVVKRNVISMQLRNEDVKHWHSADALATAVALDPSLVAQASQRLHAVPEVQGTHARGSLFVDYGRTLIDVNPNVVIVESLELPRYKKMLLGFLT